MQLEAPIPGRRPKAAAATLKAETDTLRSMGAWASQVQTGR